jgi:hypothetical protein
MQFALLAAEVVVQLVLTVAVAEQVVILLDGLTQLILAPLVQVVQVELLVLVLAVAKRFMGWYLLEAVVLLVLLVWLAAQVVVLQLPQVLQVELVTQVRLRLLLAVTLDMLVVVEALLQQQAVQAVLVYQVEVEAEPAEALERKQVEQVEQV